ncbi:hypothetical protein HD806DRAFT_525285 [Xylariaceae sp. AK1471]|nr:hypothetical protein HD806DRAFT_525285 [Xylariaceae sp. AK1471]
MKSHNTLAGFKFLERRQLYESQKPYSIDYRIATWESNIPRSNYKSVHVGGIPVQDIRGREGEFSFNANGFAVLEMDTKMQYEDFEDPQKVDSIYCHEIAACLFNYFQDAAAVQIYDSEVCNAQGSLSSLLIVNGTQGSCFQVLGELGEAANLYKRHVFVNVWRPLKGPVYDWPLALCDAQTVDSRDLNEHDHVFMESVRENIMVHCNPEQRWYYLSGQTTSEILLFRQADSDNKPAVIHSAFDLSPDAGGCPDIPRESIEVRVVVCFD